VRTIFLFSKLKTSYSLSSNTKPVKSIDIFLIMPIVFIGANIIIDALYK